MQEQRPGGMFVEGCGVGWAVRWQFAAVIFLIWLRKQLVIEHRFE
jgi:hypothetical protein